MPNYWGSALRGGLGKWLRRVSCILRNSRCHQCVVRPSCAYGFVFETELLKRQDIRVVNARPHPIVIEPPVPPPRETETGAEFSFDIILLDKANDFFPHIFYSIMKLGQQDGLGARTREDYGRFVIQSVKCATELLFTSSVSELNRPSRLARLDLSQLEPEDRHVLEVGFETPFRVKHKGSLSSNIPFHLLIRAALRRIASMEAAYGDGEPLLDYKGLISRAEKLETVSSNLNWLEIPRFSTRQRRKMLIGGPVGTVRYEGELAEFIPLLRYCETVHVGKQTFFGLGKIKLM
ncbi:MAG: CRISPR system precrRNA processing endoribonuclease RAMP protein Cas6 [Thermodesulfobacteria bacterium]|nr:CRISPR system precrRNA processing endoribonuclease RAMP protein Cas6 [Thermodesulfobacteriota bacterium]